MGKIITLWVRRARREGRFVTEDDAAMWRGFNDWMCSRYRPDLFAKRQKPSVQPGSKVQLKVVWRAPCL
jgi:hypothetical protein